MVRINRKYSSGRWAGSLVGSFLAAVLLSAGAGLKAWWDGTLPFTHASHVPGQVDMRGAPARVPVDVLRIVDGDTFEARIHRGPGDAPTGRVRIRGIDTPELEARCDAERIAAEAARDRLKRLLADGDVTLFDIGEDKYGRVLAEVATKRTPRVSAALIESGVARPYRGHRASWCERTERSPRGPSRSG